MALELIGNKLVFSFPNVHEGAKLTIGFQRTFRIPDDGKDYPLPPNLGNFPVRHTDDYVERLPAHWREHGGVFVPLYQAEALWINFTPHTPHRHTHAYPFIVKIGTGKKSALTGKTWKKGINKGDYCVIPEQPWLDGYVIEDGVIAQFVAVPLGQGLSVEEQLGGDGIGGIQIEVFPMKADCFERRWPKLPPVIETWEGRRGILRSKSLSKKSASPGISKGIAPASATWNTISDDSPIACSAEAPNETAYYSANCDVTRGVGPASAAMPEVAEMGIGAGGRMKQQVFEDPYGREEWSRKSDGVRRCFVHLANSMAWQSITGEKPPETPVTAAAYARFGLPWFDYYSDDLKSKKGSKKLAGVKTVKDKAAEQGMKGVLPENESVTPTNVKKVKQIRNGAW